MEKFTFDNVYIFVIFFLPGFISIKVYDLIISTERRDFSKSLFEVIGYSVVNFALLSWLIYLNVVNTSWLYSPFWFIVSIIVVFFGFPAVLPFFFLIIIKSKYFSKYIVHPVLKPWDYVFSKREQLWVIVNLKDGTKIGGIYSEKSFTSSYPSNEQIYLEQVWKLDDKGAFDKPIERSNGIIILGSDISSIELFK